jgi:hypothetical protein
MARTIVIDGRGLDTGEWGGRLYDQLVSEIGEERAQEFARKAHRIHMPRVRVLWPEASGHASRDITLEGLLLALGVSDADVPRVARRYRAGRGIDLGSYVEDVSS